MDPKQLKKDLKSLPHLISFVGTESVFINQAKELIIKFFVTKDTEDFNVDYVTSESDKEIVTLIQELPFDSEFKVVFLTNARRFQSRVPKSTILVALDNSLDKPHLVVDCKKLYGRSLKSFVSRKAKALGLSLDKDDVSKFIEVNGNDLSVIDNELLKLSLLGEKSFKIFKELGATNLTSRLDDIAKALATKNVNQGLRAYSDLLDLGATPSSIFGYLVYIFKHVLAVFFLKDNTDLEDFDSRKFFKIKHLFDFDFIQRSFFFLGKTDFGVRSGTFPMSILLISLIRRDFDGLDKFLDALDMDNI